MAYSLKGVAGNRAERSGFIANTHENRISRMPDVVDAGVSAGLMRADRVPGRCRQTKTRGGHGIRESLEGQGRQAVCQAQQRAHHTTEGMTRQPDVGVWVTLGDIVVEIPHSEIVVSLLL